MSVPLIADMDDKEGDEPMEEDVGTDHSDDSEDDDDDDAREEELRSKIKQLTKELELNPSFYDGYTSLVDCYKELGDLEELRKIRQKMSEVYPLTSELWLSWLKDEQNIATSKEERDHVVSLFERAVKDYMSVPLWVEYIMFMLGGGDCGATRAVCEAALTAVGTHVAEGLLIWQAVLLTEQQLYSSMASTDGSELSEEEIKDQEKQMKKVQSLYKRQVRVPLLNIDGPSLLSEMSPWFKGSIEPQIEQDLEKSMKRLEEKIPYEDELLQCSSDSSEKFSVYNRYLTFVKDNDNPSTVINLYERAITDNALDNRLWEEYISFLLKQFPTADYLILPACKRSIRNCPWSGLCVEMYINALHKFEQDQEEKPDVSKMINGVVESSFISCTPVAADAVRIWMSYLVYLRRNIDWQAQDQDEIEKFRNTCFKAIEMIDKTYGEEGDIESEIPRFLAHIEAEFVNNMEGARTIWNDKILQRNNNYKNANLWMEYINLERCYGREKLCRKLFRRALERVWDWIELIGSAFLRFEQESGTLETYEDFQKKYKDRLAVVLKVREDAALKEASNNEAENKYKKNDKRKQQQQQKKKNPSKTDEFKVPYPTSTTKTAYEKKSTGSSETFISKTVATPTEKDLKEAEPPISSGKPQKSAPPPPPPGYPEKNIPPAKDVPPPPGFTGKAAPPPPPGFPGRTVEPPPGFPGKTVEPPPGFTDDKSQVRSIKRPAEDDQTGSDPKKTKVDDEKGSRTVFLKNFEYDANPEEIRQIFNDCGEIESLEFVKDFKGRNKGFAYLIFKNIHSAQKALTKDRHPIQGRPLYINAYELKDREHYFKFKTGELEKDKLFIKGLPFSMSQEDVKNLFLKHGPIKDIRLVVYRNGFSKGACYIDYHDEETASKVQSAMDGIQLENMIISVKFSNPPSKGMSNSNMTPLGEADGARQTRPPMGVGGSQRGRLNLLPRSLLPRALQRNPPATSSKNGSDPENGSSNSNNGSEKLEKPKSNEDFRKMLLKN